MLLEGARAHCDVRHPVVSENDDVWLCAKTSGVRGRGVMRNDITREKPVLIRTSIHESLLYYTVAIYLQKWVSGYE